LLLAGCGGASHKTAPVSGQVKLDGKPLAYAAVEFVPVAGAGDKETPLSSLGTTDENGHYSLALTTGSKNQGAVVGKHKVIIFLTAQASAKDTRRTFHKQLPERYNRKTTLERDVPPEGTDKMDFDLTSK
jgi:hypothetical protein